MRAYRRDSISADSANGATSAGPPAEPAPEAGQTDAAAPPPDGAPDDTRSVITQPPPLFRPGHFRPTGVVNPGVLDTAGDTHPETAEAEWLPAQDPVVTGPEEPAGPPDAAAPHPTGLHPYETAPGATPAAGDDEHPDSASDNGEITAGFVAPSEPAASPTGHFANFPGDAPVPAAPPGAATPPDDAPPDKASPPPPDQAPSPPPATESQAPPTSPSADHADDAPPSTDGVPVSVPAAEAEETPPPADHRRTASHPLPPPPTDDADHPPVPAPTAGEPPVGSPSVHPDTLVAVAPAAASEGPPSPGRRRVRLPVVALLVVALIGIVAAGVGYTLRSGRPPRPAAAPPPPPATTNPSPSSAPSPDVERINQEATDPAPLSVAEVFPEGTVQVARRPFTRVRTDISTDCTAAAEGSFAAALTRNGCQRVVRATFVDRAREFAVTAGVAAFPDRSRAQQALRRQDLARHMWFRPLAGPAGSGADQITQAGGYAAGLVWGRYVVFAYATFSDGHAPSEQDHMLARVATELRTYAARPIQRRAAR